MKLLSPLILLFVLSFSPGCRPGVTADYSGNTDPVVFTGDYKPAIFRDQDRIEKIAQVLIESHHYYQENAIANQLPGLVYGLVVDDSLVFYGGLGRCNVESGTRANINSLFRIASMSKSFTAMAILKLRDEGKLSLHDPASRYIPELEQLHYLTSDATPVSIFNLLTMTSGFPEDNPWGDRFLDISDENLMKQVQEGISFSGLPGLRYEYSNLGFGLLGQIITKVSGMPYQEYISRNILHPLEMMDTYWEFTEVPEELLAQGYRLENNEWVAEPLLHDGAFGAMGGLITSVADFSKYISFHLSAWPPRSDPETGPVKRSSLREMHQLHNPGYLWDRDRFGDLSLPLIQGYGYGLRVMKDRDGILEVGHNGGLPGFGSSYMFYPQYGIGIMAFSNLTYAGVAVRKANYKVIGELISKDVFLPRELPVSEILELRKEQLTRLIMNWDPELESEILATNFYLDISREKRMNRAKELLGKIGEISSAGPVIPENQLRGSYIITGARGSLWVYFTLSPEADPKIQWLSMDLYP